MILAEPAPEELVEALEQALDRVRLVDPCRQHARVCVGTRPTVVLYDSKLDVRWTETVYVGSCMQ